MAVKKVTSAAKNSARTKTSAPTKAVSTKARATRMTAATATTKASATKVTTKAAAKMAKATKATTKASATNMAKARTTKVTAAKTAPKARTTKVTAAKTAPKARTTKVTAPKTAPKASTTKVTAPKARTTKVTAAKASGGRRVGGAGVSTRASAQPQRLRVRENEKPWTAKELATVHAELESDIARLRNEISVAEVDLAGLMSDIGDGAGDDPADAGTATFEREQEISLANNAREVFEQSARALARLVDGTYGVCESCGNPIGKNRLLAFPRATLCMTCKSKQERR
jgi:RNA polymerase-binding transcription factor DksA